MNPEKINQQELLDNSLNMCDVNIDDGLSILNNKVEKGIEEYKYTLFCENIFNISEEKKDDKNYVEKIEDNNKACINIFDKCLINS